jgi:mannose-6-phosphate isomerase-like protein (cupin superfamily)
MERFPFDEQRAAGKKYFEFLRTGQMSAGVYRLAAGAVDEQQPHTEEEIYYVVRGRARFVSGERDIAVAAGDVLFVPAREAHRFYEIAEELELLVFFAPPESGA